ncbi:MAG TPA: choice-of-anchor Q domain-containing protein, partial [Pyrinomonadaceae bacterium]
MRLLLTIVLSLLITAGVYAQPGEQFYAPSASFVVTASGDSNDLTAFDNLCLDANGQCSLRAAVQQANATGGSDVIGFSLQSPAITLTLGEIVVSQSVSIQGPGARNLIVQRDASAAAARIFNVQGPDGTVVDISGLSIAGGKTTGLVFGGGVLIARANTLNLTEVTLRDNWSEIGGGAFNYGTLNLFNSTVSNNTANSEGAGLDNQANAAINIVNSTVSGNKATNFGGGVMNFGRVTLNNATVTGNSAGRYGGGLYNSTATSALRNTIIAGNTATNGADAYGSGHTSLGSNLIGNSAGTLSFNAPASGDRIGTAAAPINAQLGALKNNGGQTDTHELSASSPAIDAGDNCVVTNGCDISPFSSISSDQRGANYSRPTDGNGDGTSTIDMGAFEFPSQIITCTY